MGIVFTVAFITWSTVPFVIISILSSHHSWLISGFVIRVKQWVSLVEQELLILSEYFPSPWVVCGIRIVQCCVDHYLSFVLFTLCQSIDRPLIYGFLSSLWYHQSFLSQKRRHTQNGQGKILMWLMVAAKQQLNAMKLEFIWFSSLLANW